MTPYAISGSVGAPDQVGKTLNLLGSTFEATVNITGLTTIDLTDYQWAGIVNLTSSNAVETINAITGSSAMHPIKLRIATGSGLAQVNFTPTFAPLAGDTQIALYVGYTHAINQSTSLEIELIRKTGLLGWYQTVPNPVYED